MNPLLLLLCLSEYIIYPNKAPVETNFVVIVQWLSRVRLFATPWTAYVNHELPVVQAGFIKGRGNRDQIANICWIIEKARQFQKNIYFCFIDYAKAFE